MNEPYALSKVGSQFFEFGIHAIFHFTRNSIRNDLIFVSLPRLIVDLQCIDLELISFDLVFNVGERQCHLSLRLPRRHYQATLRKNTKTSLSIPVPAAEISVFYSQGICTRCVISSVALPPLAHGRTNSTRSDAQTLLLF